MLMIVGPRLIGHWAQGRHARQSVAFPWPLSAAAGGGGGGQGENQENGWGGGGGLTARPVGAFVIKRDEVSWRSALDVDRMILVGQIVGAIAMLTLGATLRALIRRR
jgi:hypothetical protein